MNGASEANFDDHPLSGLGAYVDQVDRRIARLELAVMGDARRQLETIAHSVRVPLADLLGRAERKGRVGRYRYANPAYPPAESNGFGRMPKCAVRWIEAGKSLEAYAPEGDLL